MSTEITPSMPPFSLIRLFIDGVECVADLEGQLRLH